MASPRIVPLVLAGGAGTRLWPVSRDAMPKQFLPLVGEKSTYQQALMRVSGDLFAPMRRDSGPAIAAGAAFAKSRDPDAVVLAIAADHVILDTDLFRDACRAGRDAAAQGHIVTFGIRPTAPKTSYGYIRCGEAL